VAGDDLVQVRAEILIERRGRVSLPGFNQNFGDGATAATKRMDHSHGPVILLLDDHLAALLDFFHNRAHVAREFGFRDADRHTFDHSGYSSSSAPLDTGLRPGEALSLDWAQVRLEPTEGARYGYLTVLSGKAKSRKSRNVPLSERVVSVLRRWEHRRNGLGFHRADGHALQASLPGQQQSRVRTALKFPADFVLHCLRRTFGARLGEAGADAFTIMRLMGHSTVTVSQRYVHPSPEAVELAFGRLVALNLQKVGTNLGTPEQTPIMEIQ
jgi:hypothetical protein